MTLKRACAVMAVKSVNEDERVITGIASTPSPDRDGDIMEPDGAKFNSETPFLWQHDRSQPIGTCIPKLVKDGLQITAKLVKPTPDMPSQLIARLDEAWASIKAGLVRGLSIGFRPIEYSFLDEGGIRFLSWDLLEVSAVTIPANAECSIQTVKSYDRQVIAASGTEKPVVKLNSKAGVSAPKTSKNTGNNMNIAEQIKSFEAKRAATQAAQEDIMTKAAEDGRTLDAEEEELYDNGAAEIKSIDAHLKRLREMEALQAAGAKPVDTKSAGTVKAASIIRSGTIRVEPELEKGVEFARYVKCLAVGKGNTQTAYEYAKAQYADNARIQNVLKAAVSAGTTTDPTWAGALVEYQNFAGDFIEYLRPRTIIGQFGTGNIPSLRRVPFNVRVSGQTSGGQGYWVGQGAPKPLTKFDFAAVTLGFAKVANIAVLTDESVRFSSPSADILVRDALAGAIIERIDTDFIDPAKAEVAEVSPASITNGATGIESSGDPEADVEALFAAFIEKNLSPTTGVWIISAMTALTLSNRKNPLGQRVYPELTLNGGTFHGLPVIVSQYAGNILTLANASDIYLADDNQVVVDASREASLQMLDNPTNNSSTGASAQLVSMFQTNSIAIRAERFINWKRRRAEAVAYVTGINYSSTATTPPVQG